MKGLRQEVVIILVSLLVIAVALWGTTLTALAGAGDDVTGTVIYAPAGTKITGAVVRLTPFVPGPPSTATSDGSGAYIFTPDVPNGTYTVDATYAGRSVDNPQIVVVTGASVGVSPLTFGANEFLFCDTEITSECLKSLVVNGATDPSDLRAKVFFSSGFLQMQILGFDGTDTLDAGGFPYIDLGAATFGKDTDDVFVLSLEIATVDIAAVMGAANFISWSHDTPTDDLTITAKPVAASWTFAGCSPPPGTCPATASFDASAALQMAATDMSGLPPGLPADLPKWMQGAYIGMNGEFFTGPSLSTANTDVEAFNFQVGAAATKADGVTPNTGFFQIFMPNALLSNIWGLTASAAADMTVSLKTTSGKTTTSATATVKAEGLELVFSGFPYSVNTVDVVPNAALTADLSVTKSDSPDPVATGQNVTYTITVTNNGPETAVGVTLTDPVPSGATFVSAASCSESGGTVTCTIGDLSSGDSAERQIVVAAGSPGSMTNTATVSTDSTDPESANDSASQKTFIVVAAGVPSLTTWGLVALGALLASGVVWARRRKPATVRLSG